MKISIEKAEPGMRIIRDIFLPGGGILISSPSTLTEEIIETLKVLDVTEVHIEGEEPEKEQPVQPEKPLQPAQSEQKEEGSKIAPDIIEEEYDQNIQEPDETVEEKTPKKETQVAEEMAVEEKVHTPDIIITLSKNNQSADICIEPGEYENERLSAEDILTACAMEGIVFGINHELVSEIVELWQKNKRRYDYSNIAVGTNPTPGRESDLEFKVKYLSNPNEVDKVKNASHSWQVKEFEASFQRVKKGTVIAHKSPGKPPIPGKNVFGEPVETNEVIKIKIECDSTVEASDYNTKYSSLIEGIAFYIKGKLGVLPIVFDGSAEVNVSSDNMRADLIIHPPSEGGSYPDEKEIKKLLLEKKITFGIKEEVIKNIISLMSKDRYPEGPIAIAEGLLPVNGEDGKVEFLFNADTSLKPKTNPDGSVDFKNIDLVQPVTAGTELARLVPPTEGKKGKDLSGNELPCNKGMPAQLPIGNNTGVSPENANILIAKVDGNVKFNGTNVEVYEGYIIDGDIDYSTGNVKYLKSVVVNGDIKSGFKVECGGDLQVGGTIEDAEIKAGGNILCKLGFLGQGKGLIEAKGDVNISFMKNQTIRCQGNVNIAKEALSSTIYAKKTVTINGQPLSIAGGTIVARENITARTVGNMSGIKTMLQIGTDFTMIEEMDKIDKTTLEITDNFKKLVQSVERFEKIIKIKKKLAPKDELIYNKIKSTMIKYAQEIKKLEKRKEIVSLKMHNFDKAFIRIQHSAWPGTIFKFGDRQHLVREEVIGPKTIRLIKGEIKIF